MPFSVKTHIVPRPLHLNETGGYYAGSLIPDERTRIVFAPPFFAQAQILAGYLRNSTALPFPLEETARAEINVIARERLECGDLCLLLNRQLDREEYKVTVGSHGAMLEASTPEGMAHAVHTSLQLFPPAIFSPSPRVGIPWAMSSVEIHDRPAHAWRGFGLDCARHFVPLAELERFIDLLALHRFNTLQLHLTDDQGWRIEIKAYPKLTERGAFRSQTRFGHKTGKGGFKADPQGGFYTQEELKGLVAYAKDRGITLIPEIDLPGHATAIIAAYPEFGSAGSRPAEPTGDFGILPDVLFPTPEVMTFIRTVLAEVAEIFPAPYLHIGGDEVLPDHWQQDPRTPALLQELGLSSVQRLQPWFTGQLHQIAGALGKRIIGWDEVLAPELPTDTILHCWRGTRAIDRELLRRHQTIVAPFSHFYFDFYQSQNIGGEPLAQGGCTTLRTVYGFDPEKAGFDGVDVLGIQGQLWIEYLPTRALRDYMAFPRICALAEVAWLPHAQKEWADFRERLSVHLRRLTILGVNFRAPGDGDD